MILLLACTNGPPCPEGFQAADQRALEEIARVELAPVCLGELDHSVTDGQLHLVQAELEPAAQAARALHLQQHLSTPVIDRGAACLERAVRLEARAWHLELRLRERHDLAPLYPFESDWRERPSEALIEAWLWDNPAGGPHVDALVDGYRARCEDS